MNSAPITIVGNLVRDPEITTTTNGHSRATFSVAVEHRFKRGEEWVSEASFFNATAWRYLAEDLGRVARKGMRVIVVGRLDQRSWEDNDGNKRSSVEIIADEVALALRGINTVERRTGGAAASGGSPAASNTPAAVVDTGPEDDPW